MRKKQYRQICGTLWKHITTVYAKIPTDESVFLFLTVIFLCNCIPPSLYAQENLPRIEGRVIKVIDGDSLKIETKAGLLEVRLYGVDAPEYNQWEAKNGKKWLQRYLLNSTVQVEKISIDQYNRQLAIVYKKGNSNAVNGEAVKQGYAWVYSRYCHKKICRNWKINEKIARKAKRGVWQHKNPIPPWVWRHRKK